MSKAGRPKRVFNDDEKAKIEQMAEDNCRDNTIAGVLNIPMNTFKRHFGKLCTKKRQIFKTKLRGYQAQLAKTNPAMAIFLGKNELNQVDKQEIKQTGLAAPQFTETEKRASEAAARVFKLKLAEEA